MGIKISNIIKILALWTVFVHLSLFANEHKYYIGTTVGANYIMNSSDLPLIQEEPACGSYSNGNALGFNAGIKLGYKLPWDFLNLEARVLFDNRPLNLSGKSDCFEVLSPISNKYEPFVREHNYDGVLNYIIFDIGFNVQPVKELPFSFRLAFDAGNPIFKSDYTTKESIYAPQGVYYPDGSSQRKNEKAEIQNITSALGTSLACIYNYNISSDYSAELELSYRYALNSSVSNYEHKSNILRLNIGVSYHFGGFKTPSKPKPPEIYEEPIDEEPIIVYETIPEPKKIIDNTEITPINLVETVVTQTFPILTYYFFDEAEYELNNKYKSEIQTNNFNEQKLEKETLSIYYNSLDIIANRMRNSKGNIKIIGHSDGFELQTVQERNELAEKRALSVADYLQNKWGIARTRINIESKILPKNITNPEYPEANSENRRVEIYADNSELIAPVLHENFYEYSTNDKFLEINIYSNSKTECLIKIVAKSIELKSLTKYIEKGKNNIKIELNRKQIEEIASSSIVSDVFIILEAKTDENIELHKFPLKVNIQTERFEIGRLNLIVFDFDESDLNKHNKDMLSKFIKTSLKKDSEISIKGTTDLLGTPEYNLQLSKNRANNTKQYINTLEQEANFTLVEGTGSKTQNYTNDLPEGRFYNRTVLIEVKTPITHKDAGKK